MSDYPRFETIVVDQSAQAWTPAHPGIRVLRQERPNLPAARNLGLKAARGDILLFIDDDVTFGPGFVSAHASAHAVRPHAGCVTGRIRLNPPDRWDQGVVLGRLDFSTARFYANFDIGTPTEADFPVGCNMSYKRAALEKTGGFDARYTGNALYEEIDYVLRMKRKGFGVYFDPAAELTHHRLPTGGCRNTPGTPYYCVKFSNTGYFYFKHLFKNNPLPFLRAMRNEIEFYTRKAPQGHCWSHALRYLASLLSGGLKGALVRATRR